MRLYGRKFLLLGLFPLTLCGETFEMKARPTLTPVELNAGDVCRFTLMNGETRTVEYIGGSSAVLEVPTTEGLIATFTMRLKVDGVEIPFRRYLATQESFYEPAVVDGLRIFPDSTLEYLTNTVPMRYPSTGAHRHHPWKDARLVLQDATLPLCPEQLHPWFLDKRFDDLLIPIGDAYHGGDCWLGPFSLGEAHGGLDIRMRKGDLLYAPFACDDQFMPLWLNRNRGASSRWRGTRRWPDGTLWSINTSHVIDAIVPEHTSITNGQPYCTAAGTVVGEYNHTHFELHVCRDLNPPMPDWDAGFGQAPGVQNDCPSGQPEFYNLDPWMLFWQTFRQLRDARGEPVAEIAPFGPATTGRPMTFRSARPIPAGLTAVWTFNDGTMHVGETVDHVFAQPGAHTVTLTLTDFATRRVRETATVVVSGLQQTAPLLGVRADDESFVELKPGDLPAWGEKIVRDPFTVTRADDLVFFSRLDGAPLTPRLASAKTIAPGVEWRVYSTDADETVEVFVRAPQTGKRKLLQTTAEVSPDFKTPCFWVQHQYDGKRRWYDVNGGRAEQGQFVRYRPTLRAGRWRVSSTYSACHQPGTAYWVTVKDRSGKHRVRFEPLKNRTVGVFEFEEGDAGYVQIDAADSVGQIAIGTLRFEPVELAPLSWMDERTETRLRTEKAELETAIRSAFAPLKADSSAFCPEDWVHASKAIPTLVGYPDGEKLFKALTAWAEPLDEIPGSPEAWNEIAEWLGRRCWHRPSLLRWKAFVTERAFVPVSRTEAGLETERRAKRLLEIDRELGLR